MKTRQALYLGNKSCLSEGAMLQLIYMKLNNKYCLIIFSLMLSACTSVQKAPPQPPSKPESSVNRPVPAIKVGASDMEENVDYVALQRALGLEKGPRSLGYWEKAFDTCQVGYGYSKSNNCRQKYFVVIHFQLMCRDSEGTTSEIVRPEDLEANGNRSLKWNLRDLAGTTATDSEGFGQIQVVSPQSQKQQRFRLATSSDFLYLRAEEVQKIVTPRPWCH
jgi:hypothetical protein